MCQANWPAWPISISGFCGDPNNALAGQGAHMRRILVFIFCLAVFATVGFLFSPAASRGPVAQFFKQISGSSGHSESAPNLPLLAIDAGGLQGRDSNTAGR